jgi:hypothetical protein
LRSGTSAYTVTVVPSGGFTGAVALSASDLTKGMHGTLPPASTASTSTSTVTATGLAPHRTWTVIKGTSGTKSHTTTLTLSTA